MLTIQGLGAQVAVDTVCPNDPFGTYFVDGTSDSDYHWEVTGGMIFNQTGQDSVDVHWDIKASSHELSVVEVDDHGCVGDTMTAEVIIPQLVDADIIGPDSVCKNQIVTLSSVPAETYQWSTGDTTKSTDIKVTRDTSVSLVIDDGCHLDTASLDITALPLPNADFSLTPTKIKPGQSVTLNSNSSGSYIHTWIDGYDTLSINGQNGKYKLFHEGIHQIILMVENEYQCVDTTSRTAIVEKEIINTITPDGDGINDTWKLAHLEDNPDCEVWIFDRSRGQIFYSKGYDEPWDGTYEGKPVPEGSYYYVIDYGNGLDLQKGVINVIR